MTDKSEQAISKSESAPGDRVTEEIGSLRRDLNEIRELLHKGHGVDRAVEEFCYLPPHLEEPFRWGFIGAWGRGNSCVHLHTCEKDEFFADPDCAPENAAALAAVFANPDTIAVCVQLFNGGEATREGLRSSCHLDDAALDRAVAPLLEWRFAEWEEERLEHKSQELNGQGVNYAITLMEMAKTAYRYKAYLERA